MEIQEPFNEKWLRPINRGELLVITDGAYSDYSLQGTFRVLSDFDPGALMKRFMQEFPEQAVEYETDFGKFVTWLMSNEFVEKLEHCEWHLGDCGNFTEAHVLDEGEDQVDFDADESSETEKG